MTYKEAKALQHRLELMNYPTELFYADSKWKVQVKGILTEDKKVVDII